MASPEKKSGLPSVTEDDIAAVFGADAHTTDDAFDRLNALYEQNLFLAFEIRDRANTEAILVHRNKETSDQVADRLRHIATYVVAVLEHAAQRERAEEIRRITALPFSDDGDDASQPL